MEALYLLVPLSIAIVFLAIWLFFRMSDDGQFDDLESPGWRILQDDDKALELPGNQSGKDWPVHSSNQANRIASTRADTGH